MTDRAICFRCMLWHAPPACGHDSTLPCLSCGKPRGYRWNGADGKVAGRAVECWLCWKAVNLPSSYAEAQ